MPKKEILMRVCSPVVDLRREKKDRTGKCVKDALQETQLLFNEAIVKHREDGGWAYVEALEQPKFYRKTGTWQGYCGWVHAKDLTPGKPANHQPMAYVQTPWAEIHTENNALWPLSLWVSMGTKVTVVESDPTNAAILLPDLTIGKIEKASLQQSSAPPRHTIISTAKKLIHAPYLWGGCSAYRPSKGQLDPLTSVDCSGLAHLAYRIAGFTIPRDAIDQHRLAIPIKSSQLKEGDLIFSAPKENPENIDHVMLYSGNGLIIEASMQSGNVREVPFQEKFGLPLNALMESVETTAEVLYFGEMLFDINRHFQYHIYDIYGI